MEVKFTVVDTEARPVIFGFQNSIPCKEELVDASYGLFESIDDSNKVALKIKGDKLTLLGKGSKDCENEKLFIGVFNPKKEDVKMIETTDMIPVVQHVDGFEPTIIDSTNASGASTSEEYTRRRKQLVDAFGNKKSKQILKQLENAKIETSTMVGGKAMESILKIKAENTDMKNVILKKPRKSGTQKKQEKKEKEEKK